MGFDNAMGFDDQFEKFSEGVLPDARDSILVHQNKEEEEGKSTDTGAA